MLSDIPASFYGFASVVALALVGGKLAVTTVSLDNPFINIVISLVIGAALGYVSQKVALALAKK
jgi:Na+-driven multidrug efflux pump